MDVGLPTLERERQQFRFVAHLVAYTNKTFNDILHEMRLDPRVLAAWLRAPEFCALVKELQSEQQGQFFKELIVAIQREALKSLGVLIKLRDDDEVKPLVRLRAAQIILDKATPNRELHKALSTALNTDKKEIDISQMSELEDAALEDQVRKSDAH